MKLTTQKKVFYSLGLILINVLLQIAAFTYLYNSKDGVILEEPKKIDRLYLTENIDDFTINTVSLSDISEIEVFSNFAEKDSENREPISVSKYENMVEKYKPLASLSNEIIVSPFELDEIEDLERDNSFLVYNPLSKRTTANLFYNKEQAPIEIDYSSESNLLDFKIPSFYFYVNNKKYSTNPIVILSDYAEEETVLSICSDDYLYLNTFEQSWIGKTNYSADKNNKYKLDDIGNCYVSTLQFDKELVKSSLDKSKQNGKNIRGIDGRKAVSGSEVEMSDNSIIVSSDDENIYYAERYLVDIEQFEPYMLSFEFKSNKGGQIGYGYRFFKENYLTRMDKELRGEKVESVDVDIWDQIYEETYLEYLEVNDNEKHTFNKIISTELPDVKGVEVFLFAPGGSLHGIDYPVENEYSNLKLKSLTEEKELDLYTVYKNLSHRVILKEDILLKEGFNALGIEEEVKIVNDNLILSNDTSFENGLWEPLGNWTTKKSTEGMSISISDKAADGKYSMIMRNSTEDTAYVSKTLPVRLERGEVFELSLKLRSSQPVTTVVKYDILNKHGAVLESKDTLIELAGTDEWKEFSSLVDLSEFTTETTEEGRAINIDLQLKSDGTRREVLFDDLRLRKLKKDNGASFLTLDEAYFMIPNSNNTDETEDSLVLLRDYPYSDNWEINVAEARHFKTEDNRNLWLVGDYKNDEAILYNKRWGYINTFQWVSAIFTIVTVLVIFAIDRVSSLSKKLSSIINKYLRNLFKLVLVLKDKFLQFNKKISKKYFRPLLNKLFDTKEFSWKTVVDFRKKILDEVDTILEKIFNDLINRPVITFGLLAVLLLMIYVIGAHLYYTILLIIFLYWLINGWDSRVLAFFALSNLLLVPIMIIINQEDWAERFSILVYFFLIMTVVLQILEYVKDNGTEEVKKKKN